MVNYRIRHHLHHSIGMLFAKLQFGRVSGYIENSRSTNVDFCVIVSSFASFSIRQDVCPNDDLPIFYELTESQGRMELRGCLG
jgi:hypothetical protein